MEISKELEEAAKNYGKLNASGYFVEPKSISFMDGAKWMAERTYNEDEVRELIIKALTHNDHNLCGSLVTAQGDIRTANFGVWFEEFKKK